MHSGLSSVDALKKKLLFAGSSYDDIRLDNLVGWPGHLKKGSIVSLLVEVDFYSTKLNIVVPMQLGVTDAKFMHLGHFNWSGNQSIQNQYVIIRYGSQGEVVIQTLYGYTARGWYLPALTTAILKVEVVYA